jgi:hypothetical protein
MRGIVALVVAMSFALSGCACPPQQPGAPKPVRSKCALAQSQPRAPKFTKPSVAKKLTTASRPVSKRSKKFTTYVSKPARPKIDPPASADTGPPMPLRRPEPAHIKSPATDAESAPPRPPRKPEETSTSREHAVEPAGNFIAAKEKAMREGVHSLTGEDIRGLSQEQIKELRGY